MQNQHLQQLQHLQQQQQQQHLQQQQQQQNNNQNNQHIEVAVKNAMESYSEKEKLIFEFLKNIIINLILSIKQLRVKLEPILNQPDVIYAEIFKVYEEIKESNTSFSQSDIENVVSVISITNCVNEMNGIFTKAFANIMEDGKIDMNDSVHFMTFIHEIINLFNEYTANQNFKVSLSSECILQFLYFIVKSILVLTLDGMEERGAVLMLDACMKLIRISVLPITKCKCNYFCFS
jgi:DNA repair exonuclease SbcCD ATPase subunit